MTAKLRSLEPPSSPPLLPPLAEQAASTSGAARASASRRLGPAIVRTSERSPDPASTAPCPARIMPSGSATGRVDPLATCWSGPLQGPAASLRAVGGRGSFVPPDGRQRPWFYARHVDVLSEGHEQVVFCSDPESGLRAIIAVYSTSLGPALGGTRFYPYPSTEAALADVLALSKAMAYKNALAGLDHGGGKAVILGDPTRDKSEAKLRAYGRFVQSLGGRYVTACDVGTYPADMDLVARECRFATGRSREHGGAGDSSVLTAWGVYQGMRASAEHAWGEPTLAGRRVGISGVGKVGRHLVEHLAAEGAD